MASSAARRVAVRDFRVRFAVEPQLVPQLCASRDGRRHGVQKQGERARAAHGTCAAAPGRAVDMLLDERPCSRHPDAAVVQLYGCATPL